MSKNKAYAQQLKDIGYERRIIAFKLCVEVPEKVASYGDAVSFLCAIAAEMWEDESDVQMVVTRSMYDNYRKTITALNGSDEAHRTLINGQSMLTFNGIPLIVRKDWDIVIANKLQGAYPHRALLYKKMNLVLGADGMSDDMMIEAFYDKNKQENVWRAEYKAGTQFVHPNYIVAAY